MQNPALQIGFLFYGAHNSYFQLTAETGIVGGLAFVWLVFAVCRMGAYYNRRIVDDRPAALANAALTAGLIAFSINALTSNSFQHPRAAVFFWVLAGMQAAIGAEWFGAPAHEPAVAQPQRSLVTVSFASRVMRAVSAFFSRIWRGSLTYRAIGGPPPGEGRFVANSRLGRAVTGEGADS